MAGAHVLEHPDPHTVPTHVMLLPRAPWLPYPTPSELLRALLQRWGAAHMHVLRSQLVDAAPAFVDWRCVHVCMAVPSAASTCNG